MNIGSLFNGGDFMPGFDGTGPLGKGPLTGGGKGYCIIPMERNKRIPYGFVGIQGSTVSLANQFIPCYSYYRSYNSKSLNCFYPYNLFPYNRINYSRPVSRRGGKGYRVF